MLSSTFLVICCQHIIKDHDFLIGTNFAPLATSFRTWLALLRYPSSPNRNYFVGFRFGFAMRTKTKSQPSEAGAILKESALCADTVACTLPLTSSHQARACPLKSARLLHLIPAMKLSRTNCTVYSAFPFVWPRYDRHRMGLNPHNPAKSSSCRFSVESFYFKSCLITTCFMLLYRIFSGYPQSTKTRSDDTESACLCL